MSVADDPDRPSWWTNDKWATPKRNIRDFERYLGCSFELDVCASTRTAKAPRFYTSRQDGLRQPWDGVSFFNPPYSDPRPWVKRAARLTYKKLCPLALGLLPSSGIDTEWFHRWVLPYAEIHFVRGRIAFLKWDNTPETSPRQGNLVAIYRAGTSDIQKPIVYHSHTFEADPRKVH